MGRVKTAVETGSIMAWGGACALALLLWAAPSTAQQAQDDEDAMQGGAEERDLADERARGHFRAGRSLYDAGRFRHAAEEFAEAHRLSNRAELLFNAYVAYRDANDLEGAVRTLGGYLDLARGVPDRVNLEARLRSMSEALEQQRQTERALTESALTESRSGPAVEPSGPPLWPWILTGVGAAVVVGGTVTGILALSNADALAADCEGGCPANLDLGGRRGEVEALGITTDVLLFTGAAIALTGVVLGLVLDGGGADEPEISAGCGPTGCGATLRTRF
jgi:hypothetical protein